MEVVKGEVENIVYKNEENGYIVFEVETKENKLITCVGTLPEIYVGQLLELTGNYTTHKVYGLQLEVVSFTQLEFDNEKSIVKYLASGVIKGIGEKTAEKIVSEFGLDAFKIMEEKPEELTRIRGITLEKAREMSAEFIAKTKMRNTVMALEKYDISLAMATKIYERFGDLSVRIIESNPFALIDAIDDVSFRYVDLIAGRMGIPLDFEQRVQEGVRYVLKLAANNGHLYLPKEILLERLINILGIDDINILENGISKLEMIKKIRREQDEDEVSENIYLTHFYNAEINVARRLKEINDAKGDKFREDEAKEDVKTIEEALNIELSEEQRDAVISAIRSSLLIITGGPGTGKTTIIKVILEYYQRKHKKVKLVAPTGRAAKRMSETSMFEAFTLHRLLEVQPMSIEKDVQKFARCEDYPIDADVVIIDEMSMVDLLLFDSLLKALSYGTKLILVGDKEQLPSVGPGNVLKDLINSGYIKTAVLNKVYRQAEESKIITNAHKIRIGEYPETMAKESDFFFIEQNNETKAIELIKELASERLPKYAGCDSLEVQILTPIKKGPLGIENLNKILQELLNPVRDFDDVRKEIKLGQRVFRVNDKVMQIKNNYNISWKKENDMGFEEEKGEGVFNGDMGKVISIDTFMNEMTVKFDDDKIVTYPQSSFKELIHSYAITIHKSQGSEYKVVIIPVFDVHELLMNRNLIYTAITRAKKLLVLVGRKNVLHKMIDNNNEQKRYSNLKNELYKNFKSGK